MNKLQKLKTLVRQHTRPKCGECGGTTNKLVDIKHKDWEERIKKYLSPIKYVTTEKCKTCNGKGYIEELEFGCDVRLKDSNLIHTMITGSEYYNDVTRRNIFFSEKNINLGKPLLLREILEALSCKIFEIKINKKEIELCFIVDGDTEYLFLDLTLDPKDYTEETINQLIEILE